MTVPDDFPFVTLLFFQDICFNLQRVGGAGQWLVRYRARSVLHLCCRATEQASQDGKLGVRRGGEEVDKGDME